MFYYLRAGAAPVRAGFRSLFAFWMGGASFDAGGGTITGTLAATEGADTAAFTGSLLIQGTLAATEGADGAALGGALVPLPDEGRGHKPQPDSDGFSLDAATEQLLGNRRRKREAAAAQVAAQLAANAAARQLQDAQAALAAQQIQDDEDAIIALLLAA